MVSSTDKQQTVLYIVFAFSSTLLTLNIRGLGLDFVTNSFPLLAPLMVPKGRMFLALLGVSSSIANVWIQYKKVG